MNPINWADNYNNVASGVYESKYTIGPYNYEVDARAFLLADFYVQSNQPAEFLIEWFTGSTIHYWVKSYGRDPNGWQHTVVDPFSAIAERTLETVAETQGGTIAVLNIKDETQNYFGDTTGQAYQDWKDSLEQLPKNYPDGAPRVQVRNPGVNVSDEGLVPTSRPIWVWETTYPTGNRHSNPGVPEFATTIPVSNLRFSLQQAGTAEPDFLSVREIRDPVNSANLDCIEAGCFYIEPYHVQRFGGPASISVPSVFNLVVSPTLTDIYGSCSSLWQVDTSGQFPTPTSAFDEGLQNGESFTVNGTLKLLPTFQVSVIDDEFHNNTGPITAGKVKLRVILSVTFETATLNPRSYPDPLDFTATGISDQTDSNENTSFSQWERDNFITWEFEVDRWTGESRPAFSLVGSQSIEALRGDDLVRYVFESVKMTETNSAVGLADYQWKTKALNLSDLDVTWTP